VKNPEQSGRIGLVHAIAARVVPLETALQQGGAVGVPAHLVGGAGAQKRNQSSRPHPRAAT
jgi:hypothetical protein